MCFVRDCMAITHQNPPKDITLHLKYTDELLAHYTSQWRDREVYWMCRQRSRSVKDILCCIIDSYDKAKICLPSFPQKRTPKAQVYETIRRTWTHDSFVLRLCLHILCHLFSLCFLTVPPPSRLTWLHWGTTLTLTTCICHGYGVYMFLCEEGMPAGANWILECESGLHLYQRVIGGDSK
jgi:hypothetical protein